MKNNAVFIWNGAWCCFMWVLLIVSESLANCLKNYSLLIALLNMLMPSPATEGVKEFRKRVPNVILK